MSTDQKARLGGKDPNTVVIHNAILHRTPAQLSDAQMSVLALLHSCPRPRLACIGRLSPEKGVDVLLNALALLQKKGKQFTAVIVGDGPERAALEALALTLGVSESVCFTGHLASADVIYDSADVIVLPSRSEGLPNTLLEAMRADRPTVATAVGGIPEVVGNSEAAVLVPPENPTALAEAILLAIRSGGDAGPSQARRDVCNTFSLEKRVARLLTLYEGLGALPRTARSP
jgi:glycosyltransferase involved in cell wall biosynthesis